MPGVTRRNSSISIGWRPGSSFRSASLRSGASTTASYAARSVCVDGLDSGLDLQAAAQASRSTTRFIEASLPERGAFLSRGETRSPAGRCSAFGPRNLPDSAPAPGAATLPGARLHPAAGAGTQVVDRARDLASDVPLERDAALLRASELHVALAFFVQDRQAAEQGRVTGQRRARGDLDVIDELLGAVLIRIAAACPAGLAIEAHADSFARAASTRRGICRTSAAGRPSTRRAKPAAHRRAAAPARKSACAETSGCPRSDHASGRNFRKTPPAAEPIPAASPPAAASAPT